MMPLFISTPDSGRCTRDPKMHSRVWMIALVFAVVPLRGEPVLRMSLTAIRLAVATIPHTLPAVVAIRGRMSQTKKQPDFWGPAASCYVFARINWA